MAVEYQREIAALNIALPDPNVDNSVADMLLDKIKPSLIFLNGACDAGMTASTTTIVSVNLKGYGNDYFNNSWWLRVVKNANSIGAAPTGEEREVTDYVSTTGTFTCTAFSANVEEGDSIILTYKNISTLKYAALTSGSGNWTIPIGLDLCDVLLVGGGGGGGGGGTATGGGGGGGAEIVIRRNYCLRGSTVIAYSVGAGGTGGAASTIGNNGASTTFGILTAYFGIAGGPGSGAGTATGGFGGHKGYYAATNIYSGNGGSGGSVGAGSIGKIVGSIEFSKQGGGGGGASAAGNTCVGGDSLGTGGAHTAGDVKNSGGGGGSYGTGAAGVATDVVGIAAAANSGGGGSGGYGNEKVGGAGGSGYILITWR